MCISFSLVLGQVKEHEKEFKHLFLPIMCNNMLQFLHSWGKINKA